jgi:hypothetical protein
MWTDKSKLYLHSQAHDILRNLSHVDNLLRIAAHRHVADLGLPQVAND